MKAAHFICTTDLVLTDCQDKPTLSLNAMNIATKRHFHCLISVVIVREFSTIAKTTCTAKQCFSTYNGTCGEPFGDPNAGCFCQYRPIELSVRGGLSNCMAVYHRQDQEVNFQSTNCKSSLRYFGASGSFSNKYHRASWWTAATRVQNDQYFLAYETYLENSVRLKGNAWYWINIFRKPKLLFERQNEAEFCGMLIKGREGTVRFTIKECNDSLSKLCEINGQTTALIPATNTVTDIDDKPKVDDEPDVDEKPDVDNKPTCRDADKGVSTGVTITIISLFVSLIIVNVIVFAIVKRKSKSSGRVMDANVSNENSPPAGNVYNSLIDIGQSRGGDDYSQLNTEDQRVVYHEIRDNTDQNNYDDDNHI